MSIRTYKLSVYLSTSLVHAPSPSLVSLSLSLRISRRCIGGRFNGRGWVWREAGSGGMASCLWCVHLCAGSGGRYRHIQTQGWMGGRFIHSSPSLYIHICVHEYTSACARWLLRLSFPSPTPTPYCVRTYQVIRLLQCCGD